MKQANAQIEALLAGLSQNKVPTIDLSLERIQELLVMLGSPHDRLPPVVHVAGTNGKGSLLAYLRAILEAAGYKVHRYTSPHLVRFNERIVLAGQEISDEHMQALLKRLAVATEHFPITAFEAITTMAFLAFAETPADILLLETGMGGKYDATNVLEAPMLTAITPVSMDHMDFLGDSLSGIAAEKAGIIKTHVPCVLGPQILEVAEVIERTANQLSASVYAYGKQWSVQREGDAMRFTSATKNASYPLPALAGEHQLANAGTAIACVEQLRGFHVTDDHIAQGLRQVQWPARLQHLHEGLLASLLPAGSELWLDGGHNAGAGKELADWISKQHKHVHIICGMLKTKDVHAFLKPMAQHAKSLVAITINGEKLSQSSTTIYSVAGEFGLQSHLSDDIKSAIEHIVKNNNNEIIILVCGSLSLAGNTLWQNSTSD